MAILTEISTGRRYCLGVRCLVGRGRKADLKVEDDLVSGEHASIYYLAEGWRLRDLGSKNGTWQNGQRLPSGTTVNLDKGDRVRFGTPGCEWTFESDAPPSASARRSDGRRIEGAPRSIWLPDPEAAQVYIVCENGLWYKEDEQGRAPIHHGESVHVGDLHFALELPPPELLDFDDATNSTRSAFSVASPLMEFRVTANEEHVKLCITEGETTFDLGARAHNYCLLLLGRARLADRDRGEPEPSAGWMYTDELAQKLGFDKKMMNIHLFRARQVLRKVGGPDIELIERREDVGQLRLNSANVRVVSV